MRLVAFFATILTSVFYHDAGGPIKASGTSVELAQQLEGLPADVCASVHLRELALMLQLHPGPNHLDP